MNRVGDHPASRYGSGMRLCGIMRKEMLQILRDPSSIAIAFVLPLVLLFIFGYGVSLDAKDAPLALVVEQPSALTASLTGAFAQSPYFVITTFSDMPQAEEAMRHGRVKAIVWLRNDFSRKVLSGKSAPIGVFVNGVDANNARIIQGYIRGVWNNWLGKLAAARGRKPYSPIALKQRVWFNPGLRSRNYLVPGLIAVIMTLIGALLTALIVAREWERSTIGTLLATPVVVHEIILGKIIPYFILGMGGLVLSVVMTIWLFAVPLHGSLWVLMVASALFLLVALGMGLLISTLAKNQYVAAQVAIIGTFLPAFILSGFIFDIGSMPLAVRAVTYLIAARYYVSILQTIFAAGNVWSVILPNAAALLLMGTFFLALVRWRTSKRLQ